MVLKHVESKVEEIKPQELSENFGLMINIDCCELASAMFAWMNLTLSKEAHKLLDDREDDCNGLEV